MVFVQLYIALSAVLWGFGKAKFVEEEPYLIVRFNVIFTFLFIVQLSIFAYQGLWLVMKEGWGELSLHVVLLGLLSCAAVVSANIYVSRNTFGIR